MPSPIETVTAALPASVATRASAFDCDVFVVGGGPAGATIATLLAQRNRDVVVAEKGRHPRFHIGESLLPANAALFDALGVRAEVERFGMTKYGVEFVSPEHDHRASIEFVDAWAKDMPYAWQVRRSELDELLFRNAAAKGARTIEGCRVRDVAFDAEGASIATELDDGAKRTWRARFVVDASGRDTLLANQLRCKQKNRKHNSSALFGHFEGATRLPGKAEGNITIFWFEHGWFWFIPLADGVTSVGAVCWPYYLKTRSKPLPDFFRDTIALCPALAERLAGARLVSEVQATGNYSYSSRDLERRALRHARRRLRLHRSGVLVGRAAGDEERLRRRRRRRGDARPAAPRGARATPFRRRLAPGPARVLLVHLPGLEPDDARVLHVSAEPAAGQGSADLAVRRRHLRQDADLAVDLRAEVDVLPRFARPSRSQPGLLEAPSQQHPRRRGLRIVSWRTTRRARAVLPAALLALAASGIGTAVRADDVPLPGPVIEDAAATKATAATADGVGEPLWELGMGIAAVRFPDYRGSDQSSTYALPLPFVAYRGRFLRADRDGARAILFAGRRLVVDMSLSASVPTRSNHSDARQGMPDLPGPSRSARTSTSSSGSPTTAS